MINGYTKWGPLIDTEYADEYGFEVDKQRNLYQLMEVQTGPFSRANSTVDTSIFELQRNDSGVIVLSVDESSGVPFADTFKSDTLWEYYAPEPNSN